MTLIYRAIGILIGMVTHEWAHGFISYKLGDPTPKSDGRLSLNPLRHLDPIGVAMLLICGFGWAKPVQVNYNYYDNPKKGMALTAVAGPVMNILVAIITLFLYKHILVGSTLLMTIASINVSLAVFNLIPIPPLDGSKILAVILPEDLYHRYMRIEQYGMYILIGLMALGSLNGFLREAIGFVFTFIYNIV